MPHFYLKNFASEPKRINIFNLRDGNTYRNGNLRHQCYRQHFYGATDEVEDALSHIESNVSPAIKRIIQGSRLPGHGANDHMLLLRFISLQLVRTEVAAQHVKDSFDKAKQILVESYPRADEAVIEKVTVDAREAALISLKNANMVFETFHDLDAHLIVNTGTTSFITSDNPSFKYNLYCEGIKGLGLVGTMKSGFLVFTPLSPSHIVLLYDKEVYKVGEKNSEVTRLNNDDDIIMINSIQALSADCTLLFSRWDDRDHIGAVARRMMRHRSQSRTHVQELIDINNPRGNSVIHFYEKTPNVNLKLPFLGLLRQARRVTLDDRANRLRRPYASLKRRSNQGAESSRIFRPKKRKLK